MEVLLAASQGKIGSLNHIVPRLLSETTPHLHGLVNKSQDQIRKERFGCFRNSLVFMTLCSLPGELLRKIRNIGG